MPPKIEAKDVIREGVRYYLGRGNIEDVTTDKQIAIAQFVLLEEKKTILVELILLMSLRAHT